MEHTEWLLKKLDKDAGEELVYVLAEFVYFDYECVSICVPRWLHVYAGDECVCVFVHYSRKHLLSLLHNGGVSGEFYH